MTVPVSAGALHPGGGASIPDPSSILLVDPSLFTAPYDAALSAGLEACGLRPSWATRRLRPGEAAELGPDVTRLHFYPLSDGPRRSAGPRRGLKGVEHIDGMRRLLGLVGRGGVDLVHFQWLVLPRIDAFVMRRIRRRCPVVLTVHDTLPYNGKAVDRLQRDGFDAALKVADRLIVHTGTARQMLAARGIAAERIAVVPHGLLAPPARAEAARPRSDGRWRIVQFGKLQDYKGVDVLVEALGLLSREQRAGLSVVVAGEPLIDMAPLRARAEALGLTADTLEFRLFRHDDDAVAALLGEADAFVFPYRAIEASGVLFLVAAAGKWLIASDLGAFSTMIGHDGEAGALVGPGDPVALAAALDGSIGRVPSRRIADGVPGWPEIGMLTRAVYRDAARAWQAGDR